jgi:hypothetical protein
MKMLDRVEKYDRVSRILFIFLLISGEYFEFDMFCWSSS